MSDYPQASREQIQRQLDSERDNKARLKFEAERNMELIANSFAQDVMNQLKELGLDKYVTLQEIQKRFHNTDPSFKIYFNDEKKERTKSQDPKDGGDSSLEFLLRLKTFDYGNSHDPYPQLTKYRKEINYTKDDFKLFARYENNFGVVFKTIHAMSEIDALKKEAKDRSEKIEALVDQFISDATPEIEELTKDLKDKISCDEIGKQLSRLLLFKTESSLPPSIFLGENAEGDQVNFEIHTTEARMAFYHDRQKPIDSLKKEGEDYAAYYHAGFNVGSYRPSAIKSISLKTKFPYDQFDKINEINAKRNT